MKISSTSISTTKLYDLIKNDEAIQDEIKDAKLLNKVALDLYKLRIDSGLSQKQLAEKLGVKQSNISRWEQLGYQGYKLKGLSRLVRALGGQLQLSINNTYVTNYVFSMTNIVERSLTMTHPNGATFTASSRDSMSIDLKFNSQKV